MADDSPRDPGAPRFGFDEQGLGAAAVTEQLAAIARSEDEVWADGGCSGTIYCGDRDVYDLSSEGEQLLLASHVVPLLVRCSWGAELLGLRTGW